MARPSPRISVDYLLLAAVRIKVYILKRSANAAARNFPQRLENGSRGIPSLIRWASASFVMHREISDAIRNCYNSKLIFAIANQPNFVQLNGMVSRVY